MELNRPNQTPRYQPTYLHKPRKLRLQRPQLLGNLPIPNPRVRRQLPPLAPAGGVGGGDEEGCVGALGGCLVVAANEEGCVVCWGWRGVGSGMGK